METISTVTLPYLEFHRKDLSFRYPTFRKALELLTERGGTIIVETGCVRLKDDWGAGMSTLVFADWCMKHGGRLTTVDNDPVHLRTCMQLTGEYADVIHYAQGDSTEFLKRWLYPPIDLLYLDSFDYPYGELLNQYGGQKDIEAAMKTLHAMSEAEIVEKHGDIIGACQMHCARELLAGLPKLSDKGLVLMDDANLPGGGKPRLARLKLQELGWTEILDGGQQTLWGRM